MQTDIYVRKPAPPVPEPNKAQSRRPQLRDASAPPFGRYERSLAGRYLRAKRVHGGVALISVLAFIAITAAVGLLIITMSVMNGFRETLLGRILGVNGHVFVQVDDMPPDEVNRIMRAADSIPGVTHITPVINAQALVLADGTSSGVIVRGIRRAELQRLSIVSETLKPAHALDNFQGVEAPEIVLGDRLASALGVREGMTVSIVSPQGVTTPFGYSPRRKSFVVGGTFSVGMAEYDSAFVYMPLEQAQILFGRGAGVDQIELRLQNPDAAVPIMTELRDKIGPNALIFDWKSQSKSLVDALVVERNVMRLIFMIIVTIAMINVAAALIILVKDKTRDIAILRTIGATRGSILRIFFMAGAFVGVIGLAAGLLLGIGFCTFIKEIQDFIQAVTGFDLFPGAVYSLETLPAKIEWNEVTLISFFTVLLTLIATLTTAWWASRLDPVEALRYE